MEQLHGEYSGYILCEAMDVPRGTFYNHIYRNKREQSSYSERRAILRMAIHEVFDESQQRFGAEKINAVLHDRGYVTSPKLVAELMRELGLHSISPSSKREHLKWQKGENKNIVKQKFTATAPNKVWVSDITTYKFKEKYYYICAIIDLFSRKIVAYRIANKNNTHLCTFTFRQAWGLRKPDKGLIFHSDRGTQYVSRGFQKLLHQRGAVQSLSRSGKPHDNAVAESFFSHLKQEELYRHQYRSEAEMMRGIHDYIQFYNGERPHATLQYVSPNRFEENAERKLVSAADGLAQ